MTVYIALNTFLQTMLFTGETAITRTLGKYLDMGFLVAAYSVVQSLRRADLEAYTECI